MVRAHPSLLRELVDRCETLRRLPADGGAEAARQLEDATYTLCVVTGTRQLESALYVARQQLAGATAKEQPLRHTASRQLVVGGFSGYSPAQGREVRRGRRCTARSRRKPTPPGPTAAR
ncbi:DUF5133 domain-containing protein [Streptomyces brevispora]|uniref:DUF5133 domain-containing protein n=1 Tax=Streptomyces brevispora TaxID=887462 RepID=UPI00371A3334